MNPSFVPGMDIPVFAGQGTSAGNAVHTQNQAFEDASSPSGSLLLLSCYRAFRDELSTLSPSELLQADIDIADFPDQKYLLSASCERYTCNAIVHCSYHFLIQSLRYLAFVESIGLATNSLNPFTDVLRGNMEQNLGILGFSSGILPACVVASSFSTLSYISCAVEMYRLAIWIGIRTQMYRMSILNPTWNENDAALPWAIVLSGASQDEIEAIIARYQAHVSLTLAFLEYFLTKTL
jgi:hypothetical protein